LQGADPILPQAVEASVSLGARAADVRYYVRTLRRSPTFLIGFAVVGFWVVMGVAWPWLSPQNPQSVSPINAFAPPSAEHWIGTDHLGRDVFARMLAGSSSVLAIAPAATILAVCAGPLIGLVAGFYRGFADDLLMRFVDAQLAFPGLITAVMVLSFLGPSEVNVILLIAIFFTPLSARVARSAALSEREKDYIAAARMRGEGGLYTMLREILPNITGPIVVEGTVRLGYAVFTAATLSFLGLGLQPPSPDWGRTIAEQRNYLQDAPWALLAPALALATLVVGVNLIADGLRKAVQD
jgi:peptide/nickel transport system permease protein